MLSRNELKNQSEKQNETVEWGIIRQEIEKDRAKKSEKVGENTMNKAKNLTILRARRWKFKTIINQNGRCCSVG